MTTNMIKEISTLTHTKQINSWVYALKLCGSFENYLIQQKNRVMQQVRSFRKLRCVRMSAERWISKPCSVIKVITRGIIFARMSSNYEATRMIEKKLNFVSHFVGSISAV